MKKDSVNNFIDIVICYLNTKDLKKLWHFYLFIIIFNTWLELTLFALYRPLDINLAMFLALAPLVGLPAPELTGLLPLDAVGIFSPVLAPAI